MAVGEDGAADDAGTDCSSPQLPGKGIRQRCMLDGFLRHQFRTSQSTSSSWKGLPSTIVVMMTPKRAGMGEALQLSSLSGARQLEVSAVIAMPCPFCVCRVFASQGSHSHSRIRQTLKSTLISLALSFIHTAYIPQPES